MFGKNLKKIRSVHGLSQQQFAELFDLKRATLGAYEEGRSNAKMETVIKIANHFSIDIEDLLTKELTVNRLLKFNEAITTTLAADTSQNFPSIPCVIESKKLAFIEGVVSQIPIDLPLIALPNVTAENKMAFVIDDLTMSGSTPAFFPKDIVIAEKLLLNDIEKAAGKLVVVVTDSQLLFRKLNCSQNKLTLMSNQSGIDPVVLSLKDIKGIWVLSHVFHYTIPVQNEMEQRLALLENTIAALSKNV